MSLVALGLVGLSDIGFMTLMSLSDVDPTTVHLAAMNLATVGPIDLVGSPDMQDTRPLILLFLLIYRVGFCQFLVVPLYVQHRGKEVDEPRTVCRGIVLLKSQVALPKWPKVVKNRFVL